MNWPLFISTFSLIFIAELPDKTALATVMMATRGRPRPIFTGVALAFLIQCLVAVALGSVIGLLPPRWVHVGAGLMFLGFAVHTWYFRAREEEIESQLAASGSSRHTFLKDASSAFMVIFIAEWGDLTQLATASMAARYTEFPVTILAASVCALWSVAAIAIFVGNRMTRVLEGQWLHYLGTAVFAGVGSWFLVLAAWPELSGP